ncbi:MAG: hypothetical protein Q7U78_02310 [Gallionella sp.]|nr:hypothetical protein [Gallionella sp.]
MQYRYLDRFPAFALLGSPYVRQRFVPALGWKEKINLLADNIGGVPAGQTLEGMVEQGDPE